MALNTLEFYCADRIGRLWRDPWVRLPGGGGRFLVSCRCFNRVLPHVVLHYAIGAALVSVIATFRGAAAAYVRRDFAVCGWAFFGDCNDGGGAGGGGADLYSRVSIISIIFGVVLLYSAYLRP